MSNEIAKYSKLSELERKRLCRWLARQNLEIMYEVFRMQKSHFHRLKDMHTDADLTSLSAASFMQALKMIHEGCVGMNRKNKSHDLMSTSKTTRLRAKQFANSSVRIKYEKLMNLRSVVMNLIEVHGYSYRQVSGYLEKYHRLSVSHTLIGKFYRELKEGAKDE